MQAGSLSRDAASADNPLVSQSATGNVLRAREVGRRAEAFSSFVVRGMRQGLRLHDNPPLAEAIREGAEGAHPVFVFDPGVHNRQRMGLNRMRFLLESLECLDASLRRRNSRLIVLHGSPRDVITEAARAWEATKVTYEVDEAEFSERDKGVTASLEADGVEVTSHATHTLYDPQMLLEACGKSPPVKYEAFLSLLSRVGEPEDPISAPDGMPPPLQDAEDRLEGASGLPTLEQLGYECSGEARVFPGGENEGSLGPRPSPSRRAGCPKPLPLTWDCSCSQHAGGWSTLWAGAIGCEASRSQRRSQRPCSSEWRKGTAASQTC